MIEEFNAFFKGIKNKRIAIYGIGEKTRLILESVKGYNFVALLDPGTIGQMIYEKKVIAYEELENYQVDVVIIVSRKCFVNLIYRRIALYCLNHGIEVYDIYGNMLMHKEKLPDMDVTYKEDMDCYEMCRHSLAAKLLQFVGDDASNKMVDLSIQRLFRQPKIICETKGKVPILCADDLGYAILGPIITQYIYWLVNEVKEKKIDCVVFGARDGYLFRELYIKMSEQYKLPKCKYIYTSRMCCVAAGIENEEDIEYSIKMPFSGKPQDMLRKRFFLEDEDIMIQDDMSSLEYIMAHKDKILDISKQRRNNYTRYLQQELGQYSNIAYVDFFASGTCQLYIERFLNKKIQGLYFYHIAVDCSRKETLNIKSFYPANNEGSFFEKVYISLESMITSFEPTLREMAENLSPIFIEEVRTTEELEVINQIQTGIINFFKEYKNSNLGMSKSIEIMDYLLSFYDPEISEIKIESLKKVTLMDEFANREFNVL